MAPSQVLIRVKREDIDWFVGPVGDRDRCPCDDTVLELSAPQLPLGIGSQDAARAKRRCANRLPGCRSGARDPVLCGRVRQAPPVRLTLEWVFRSRVDGQIVIVQLPNLSLWIFIVARVVGAFLDAGTRPATGAQVVATLAIAWWAADELVRGVNPWRRFLGSAILAVQLVALLR